MRRTGVTRFAGLWALTLAACGDSAGDAGDGQETPEVRVCAEQEQEPECEVGALRCEGAVVERCATGSDACRFWDALYSCAGACVEGACEPPAQGCEPSAEVCDGQDNDCDGALDEGGVCDAPCEGVCEPGEARCEGVNLVVCVGREGCGEWSAPRGCGAGLVCEEGACVEAPACADYDGDGFGVGVDCAQEDCRDRDPLVHPGAPEACNGLDDDCDGLRDEDAGCPACPEGSCEPGSVVCSGGSVAACVRGPDGCGALDVVERCELGEVCAAGACVEFECAEDGFEENDDAQGAAALEGEALEGVSLCPGDEDWFELPAGLTGGWLEVWLAPEDGASDLDLVVWAGEQELGRSAGLGPVERVSAWAPQDAGRLLVQVVGYEGAAGAYRLAWRAPQASACVADGWEDNDASASASALAEGERVEATLCRGDVDWYYPDPLAPGETWAVTAQVDGFFGELGLTLLDAVTREVLATTEQEGGPRLGYTHSAAAREARPVFLQVRPLAGGSFGAYSLEVRRWGEALCQPDPYDASVTQALAAPVSWEEVEGGRVAQLQAWLCYDEELWLDLGALPFDAKLGVTATAAQGPLDPELELLDADGGVLAQAARLGPQESLRVELPVAQRGWLRVRGFGGAPGEVSLALSVLDPVPCEDDALEPNDEPGGGTRIDAGARLDASLCEGDEDWFELGRLARGPGLTRLDLALAHDEVRGAVEALLFRGTRAVARSTSEVGGERLRYELTGPEDTYSLLVRSRGGASLNYSLGFNEDATPACVEDAWEPNEGLETTAAVALGGSLEGALCGGEDWFLVEVPSEPGMGLRASLALAPGAGNLDLDLLVDGSLAASSLNLAGDEVLEAQTGLGAVYHLVVYSPGQDQGAYTLSVELLQR